MCNTATRSASTHVGAVTLIVCVCGGEKVEPVQDTRNPGRSILIVTLDVKDTWRSEVVLQEILEQDLRLDKKYSTILHQNRQAWNWNDWESNSRKRTKLSQQVNRA